MAPTTRVAVLLIAVTTSAVLGQDNKTDVGDDNQPPPRRNTVTESTENVEGCTPLPDVIGPGETGGVFNISNETRGAQVDTADSAVVSSGAIRISTACEDIRVKLEVMEKATKTFRTALAGINSTLREALDDHEGYNSDSEYLDAIEEDLGRIESDLRDLKDNYEVLSQLKTAAEKQEIGHSLQEHMINDLKRLIKDLKKDMKQRLTSLIRNKDDMAMTACPSRYRLFYPKPRKGTCLWFSVTTGSWAEAHTYCELMGGTLAEVRTQSLKRTIAKYIGTFGEKHTYFVGGTDLPEEGRWRWLRSRKRMGFNAKNDDENCMVVHGDTLQIGDDRCDRRLRFVCQRPVRG